MASEEDKDENRLSEVVSDCLKCEGYFMELVGVYRSDCLLTEKIEEDLFESNHIKCGSFIAEGSFILGSDMDHMYVATGIIAVKGKYNFNEPGVKMHIFTMALDNCSPGYTRLEVLKINPNSTFLPDIELMIVTAGNRLFLSSEEFLKTFQNGLIKKYDKWTHPHVNASFYSHGPCLSALMYNFKGISSNIEYDMTFGIKCHSWPVAASEWNNRARSKGWPSREIVHIISAFPVHVVPVGDYRSNISSMQWRFSFSKAERELIWNFNDTQFQCYVLMKSILKGKLQSFSPDELSGYQMKNLLFWISEEYGVKMFSKENLLFCLEICFERFKQHILKGSLPHYIIRDRNLLAGKLDTRTRQRIADEIDKILEDVFVTIFECRHIVLRSIKFLKMYNGSKRDFICQVKAPLNYCLMECPENVKLEIMLRSFKVCLSMVHLPNNSNKLLAFIEDMKSGNNCSRNILPCMLKTAKRFGSIQLGIMFHEERCRTEKTQTEIDIYLHHTHGLLKIGTDLDELSGKLYLVTFELLNNKIDTAWALLSLVMSNTKPFVYSGWCMEKNMVWVLKFLYSEILVVNYDMVHNELLISYDVMFPKNVVNFVPEPIKYELFLLQCTKQSNFCVYHPVVYAFYLNFEIKRKKNEQMSIQNEILRKLSSFIEDCNGGYERHRAYNILGYCYYVCGRINEAFTTFCLSMQEKCDSTNVAVYHLCIVLSEYFTNKDV